MPGEDLYGDGAPADESGGSESESDTGYQGRTSLLPKSLFPGKDLKPGDKCDITIVGVHEDQYEVKGCGDEKETESEEPPAETPPKNPMGEMME